MSNGEPITLTLDIIRQGIQKIKQYSNMYIEPITAYQLRQMIDNSPELIVMPPFKKKSHISWLRAK